MRVFITGDTDSESGVSQAIHGLCGSTLDRFAPRDYGSGLAGVCVVLMCQRSCLKLRQRIRLVKKERMLYLDVMLDLEQMKQATSEKRRRTILERIGSEVPAVVHKYHIRDFDEAGFMTDLSTWLDEVAQSIGRERMEGENRSPRKGHS